MGDLQEARPARLQKQRLTWAQFRLFFQGLLFFKALGAGGRQKINGLKKETFRPQRYANMGVEDCSASATLIWGSKTTSASATNISWMHDKVILSSVPQGGFDDIIGVQSKYLKN